MAGWCGSDEGVSRAETATSGIGPPVQCHQLNQRRGMVAPVHCDMLLEGKVRPTAWLAARPMC